MRKNKAGRDLNGFTMLVLDDDASIAAALKAYFETSGYQVDAENNPLTALEHMRTHPYDIILLDFLMTPICGDEVVARLRQYDRNAFVIMLTGHRELAPPLNTIRELDIQGYYEKSDRYDQLELLVESCIKSIKQMRLIRQYRDGLDGLLRVAPRIHELRTLREAIDHTLGEGSALFKASDGFLCVDESGQSRMCRGFGTLAAEEGEAVLTDTLRAGAEDAKRSGSIASAGGMAIAPLLGVSGQALGAIGLNIPAPDVDKLQLFDLFARQAAAAVNNAVMYSLIQEKNDQLEKANQLIRESYMETITALRLIVDAKDIYTRGHSDRVSQYAVEIARALNKGDAFVERVRVAGLFHDIGKVGTADSILTKSTNLTESEYAEIKLHPARGARILSCISMFGDLSEIVKSHHERPDGKGYPDGLRTDQIPLAASIISIADAFDAMTSDRHYRPHLTLENALEQLTLGRGTQFDSELVDTFIALNMKNGQPKPR